MRPYLYALSAVFLWSTVATAFKIALNGLSYAQLLFYASLTSCSALFFFLWFSRNGRILSVFSPKKFFRNLVLGALNPFFYYLVLFKAYSLLPAQEAQPLNYTWPIALTFMSAIFLKEKITLKKILGLLFSFLGVIIIATRGDIFSMKFHSAFGSALAVGSSIIWASYWIINLKDVRDPSEKLFFAFLFGSVFSAFYIFLFDSFIVPPIEFLLAAVYVGLFEMGVTFFLWMKALTLAEDKGKISTFAYLSPFISLAFIFLILKEEFFPSSILGLTLIIGGILIQQIKARKVNYAS